MQRALAEAVTDRKRFGRANVIGVLSGMQSSAITVRQARCAMVRNRNANCMKCAEACTSGCIYLRDGVLCVDESKCVGCGTCATVCPTCALESHNPSDSELFAACVEAQRDLSVVIMCHPCAEAYEGLLNKEAVAEVVCLGRVDESLICGLAAKGVREVSLVCADCERCDQGKGRECAEMVAKSANNLLRLWRRPPVAKVASQVPRRVLLDPASLGSGVLKKCGTAHFGNEPIFEGEPRAVAPKSSEDERIEVLRVMKDGTLPHFVPERRERLLDGLSSFGKPAYDNVVSRLWGCVAIDPWKCVSCRMCATFCPTGAIAKLDGPDGKFGVQHYPGDCVKCGTCRDICPAQAITIQPNVKTRYLFDGSVHRYEMRKRAVELNRPDQILNTMKRKIPGNVYER